MIEGILKRCEWTLKDHPAEKLLWVYLIKVPAVRQSISCERASYRLTEQERVLALTGVFLFLDPSNDCFGVLRTYGVFAAWFSPIG